MPKESIFERLRSIIALKLLDWAIHMAPNRDQLILLPHIVAYFDEIAEIYKGDMV